MTFIWITGFKVQNTENQKHKSWIILSLRCAFETKTGLINLPYKCCSDQGEFNSVKRYKLIVYLLFLSCYLECFPCFLVTILPWPQASLSYLLPCICFSRSGVITNATRFCSLRAREEVLCTVVPIFVNCSILSVHTWQTTPTVCLLHHLLHRLWSFWILNSSVRSESKIMHINNDSSKM